MRSAPAKAIGYQLVLFHGSQVWAYPPKDRQFPRWQGEQSDLGWFAIDPFEPPIVPIAENYGILFYDQAGRELQTPVSLLPGVAASPLRRVSIEDGDRLR